MTIDPLHIVFLNPQGNFDAADSYLAQHPDFGGQLVYVKEVAQEMARLGHKVDIITRRIVDPDWPEFAAPLATYPGFEDNLRILRFDCGGGAFLEKELLWPHLQELVDNMVGFYGEDLPDFATAHYADGGYMGVLLKQRTGIRFSFTGHSLGAQKLDKLGMNSANQDEMEARFHFSSRIAAERRAMRKAYRIITSTDQERRVQYAHPLYHGAVDPDEPGKFSVIPPGVNTRIFNTESSQIDAEVEAQLDAKLSGYHGPVVIVSSRLDEKKNIIGVVEAFARSQALRDKAHLVICIRGLDDPYADFDTLPEAEQKVLQPILDTIDAAGMRDKVHYLNLMSQQALAAAYRQLGRRGSVFALTAFYEPFGLAPIEAASCGLACVATSKGGPSEIFEDGSGVLVDPFDAADIARGLETALENQADLARRSAKRVLSMYTWSKTAEKYLAVADAGVRSLGRGDSLSRALDAGELITGYLAGK
ncbi:MAG: glycosyltransferase family 1 protein [Hyphomicrobiales bacterium]|nr:MAG: glycosyltransferase family 1 protein [Hyphomicrobiales bacterium]